eukprot:GFUD01036821.1.p1 GENE.GFUD01036821.1~~GFUD01036821.1.p1  ORF type:complete len:127 (-),score=33.93 GFUD01036821.1:281-661(-)
MLFIRPVLVLFIVAILSVCEGKKVCADGSTPTCENGSTPVRDQNRSTPPCPGQGSGRMGKANTCVDGSTPTKVKKAKKGGRRGGRQGRCSKSEKICCDGSTPSFDQNRNTPQCGDGERATCSRDLC